MCNVSLISKSNSASYEYNSQYKVVMMHYFIHSLGFVSSFSHRYDLHVRLNSGYLLHMLNYHCIAFSLSFLTYLYI